MVWKSAVERKRQWEKAVGFFQIQSPRSCKLSHNVEDIYELRGMAGETISGQYEGFCRFYGL